MLFCSNLTSSCEAQKLYQQPCLRDEECVNNCVCSMQSCSFYYSLQNGVAADNKSTKGINAEACSSGYMQNGTCQTPPKSTVELRTCSSNNDCITQFPDGTTIAGYSQCQCGTNGGGYSYCSLVEGDSVYQSMI